MNFNERITELKGILYTHCKDIFERRPSFDESPSENPKNGTITGEGIKLNNGSLINFIEMIKEGRIVSYAYEYIRPDTGFFFQYHNEGIEDNEGIKDGIRKPLHHLHVGIKKDVDKKLLEKLPKELIEHDGPHYKAPDIEFHEFMGIIVTNFFDEDEKKCKKMLKSLGLLPKVDEL